jgi:heme/copper-type cytochrome/quinol oxidase subunit 3
MSGESGLRNPPAAVRGIGAAALGVEGLVLLLAIVPLRVLGNPRGVAGTAVIVVLALACFVLAAMMRRSWAWTAGTVLQVVLFVSGFFVHVALSVAGVVFGLAWWYVLHVRRTVLGPQKD